MFGAEKALAKWTRKFAKPELAYGLAKGGQTDSQVAKSRKFHAYHWLMRFYNRLLVSTCAGWPNGKKLASKFELDQSQRKSTQVGVQTKRKLN